MRRIMLSGLLLAAAAVLMVVLSDALGLDLESVALLGAALGAAVALVPDRGPAARLVGFGLGFVVAMVGYAARALWLPDTSNGRAVAVGLVVLGCTGLAAASRGRLPLWSVLLGTAALAGAYEFAFTAAPPEMADTALTATTTLVLTVGIGFLAASIFAPAGAARARTAEPAPAANDDLEIMEHAS
jgi:hypothetical protein